MLQLTHLTYGLETRESETDSFQNDRVQEMLDLADRLVEQHGGRLDDSAIAAVAEATGADLDYVRLALTARAQRRKEGLLSRVRASFLGMEPSVRTYVGSSYLAALTGVAGVLGKLFGDQYGLGGMFQLVCGALMVYLVGMARNERTAVVAGGTFGALYIVASAFMGALLRVPGMRIVPIELLLYAAGGAVVGLVAHRTVKKHRNRFGLKDPVAERQQLLHQLVEIQDKLKEAEQHLAFLSADIVGSTQLKTQSDPLAVEFTFTEYHKFVDMVVRKHGGTVHSTAGDGVTCAFPQPAQAFAAGKNLQAGLAEFNAFRNRIGSPIRLRVGIHTGTVRTPHKDDVRSVNFSEVIDVAAHIQKHCPVGSVAISELAAATVPGGAGAIAQEWIEVQSVRVAVWSPRQVVPLSAPASMPPLPESAN